MSTNVIKGRLTIGNKPLHERRKHLTNGLRDCVHMTRTSMANWPDEYAFPPDHPIHELLDVIEHVCDITEEPINANPPTQQG